ncbi:MAG: triose-phosphate isomerase [bacterium]|nr:triose-phosphate isomerase [bacterium]
MRPLIIANWKMNPANSKDAFDLARAVVRGLEGVEADVVLCPPFVYVPQLLPSPNVFIGSQDAFWEQEGAYTGEVSPLMLKNLGCSYVILGHSERRKLGETSQMVAKKIQAVLDAVLVPVVCIGEDIEREMNITLKDIKETDVSKIVFVYEPEGAISTEPNAKPASLEQLERALNRMRTLLPKTATILYGGSVNSRNIQGFMGKGVQGALVGAVSLDAQEFIQLVKNAVSM